MQKNAVPEMGNFPTTYRRRKWSLTWFSDGSEAVVLMEDKYGEPAVESGQNRTVSKCKVG